MKSYRPSNGTEGMSFIERQCGDCVHDKEQRETGENGCSIIAAAMAFDIEDAEYPKEWVIDKDYGPMCTNYCYEKNLPKTERCKNTDDMFS